MPTPSRDPEPLGGADAVPKTTYVVGQGTEPEKRDGGRAASPGGGLASLAVAAVLILAVAAMVFMR